MNELQVGTMRARGSAVSGETRCEQQRAQSNVTANDSAPVPVWVEPCREGISVGHRIFATQRHVRPDERELRRIVTRTKYLDRLTMRWRQVQRRLSARNAGQSDAVQRGLPGILGLARDGARRGQHGSGHGGGPCPSRYPRRCCRRWGSGRGLRSRGRRRRTSVTTCLGRRRLGWCWRCSPKPYTRSESITRRP